MPDRPDVQVIHLVGCDTPRARLELLRDLRSRADVAAHQSVLQIGWGKTAIDMRPCERVGGWLHLGRIRGRALADRLSHGTPTVLHIWSEHAFGWLIGAAAVIRGDSGRTRPALVIDRDSVRSAKSVAWLRDEFAGTSAFVCTSQRRWQITRSSGAPDQATLVIRDGVDFGAINQARSRVRRDSLEIAENARVIAMLPPIERQAGAFLAGWSALLVDQVRRPIVALLPGGGREVERIRRFFAANNRAEMLLLTGDALSLPEILALADLALFLPPRDESTAALAWAMASGVSIVSTATPAVTELLAHRANAFLAQPANPKDAARRILEALEDPAQCRRHAELARSQAYAAFSRQRMFEQYARLYSNLSAGDPANSDIDDPVFAKM